MSSLKGWLLIAFYDRYSLVIDPVFVSPLAVFQFRSQLYRMSRRHVGSRRVTVTAATIQQCGEFELPTTVPTLDLNRTEYLKLPEIEPVSLS